MTDSYLYSSLGKMKVQMNVLGWRTLGMGRCLSVCMSSACRFQQSWFTWSTHQQSVRVHWRMVSQIRKSVILEPISSGISARLERFLKIALLFGSFVLTGNQNTWQGQLYHVILNARLQVGSIYIQLSMLVFMCKRALVGRHPGYSFLYRTTNPGCVPDKGSHQSKRNKVATLRECPRLLLTTTNMGGY